MSSFLSQFRDFLSDREVEEVIATVGGDKPLAECIMKRIACSRGYDEPDVGTKPKVRHLYETGYMFL